MKNGKRPSCRAACAGKVTLRASGSAGAMPAVNPPEQEQQTLILYRWTRHLILDLPAGSKPGIEEEIGIFSETDVEILDATAMARSENRVVYVEVNIDVSRFEPGEYFLGVGSPVLRGPNTASAFNDDFGQNLLGSCCTLDLL